MRRPLSAWLACKAADGLADGLLLWEVGQRGGWAHGCWGFRPPALASPDLYVSRTDANAGPRKCLWFLLLVYCIVCMQLQYPG